jgi:hypothetical protein
MAMSNDSTQIDPNVLNEESLEFEFALWNKDIGRGGAVRALVERRLGNFK